MSIREALRKYHDVEIELLLAYILKKPKEFLFMHPEMKLSSYQVKKLSSMAGRRQRGEPIAYILGYKDFYGLRFKVNRSVLIPRPETEWLIQQVQSAKFQMQSGKQKIRILDVGTGSGAIIVSLAKTLTPSNSPSDKGRDKHANESYEFYASDVSKKALAAARENAKRHKVKIKFAQSDLLADIKERFDAIIANLPYVPREIYDLKFKDLRFEPGLALVDPKKDFDIYERFLRQAPEHLRFGGAVYLEMDPKTKAFIAKWGKKYMPGARANFFKDFNGLWRYAIIRPQIR